MILHWWTQNSSEMSFYSPPPLIYVADFEVNCFWHSFLTLCCSVDVVNAEDWSLLPISSPRAELATTSAWDDKYLGKDGLGMIGWGGRWAATVVAGEGRRWRISMYCSSNYAGFRFYNNNAITMGEACLLTIDNDGRTLILLPKKQNADDGHNYPVYNSGNDFGSPYTGLIWWWWHVKGNRIIRTIV